MGGVAETTTARNHNAITERRPHEPYLQIFIRMHNPFFTGFSMSGVPYIRFYGDDWLSGTQDLSLEESGALIKIVAMTASSGQAPKLDLERISRRLGVTQNKSKKIIETLVDLDKINIIDGRIINSRAVEELKKSQEFCKKQSERASRNGSKKDKKPSKNNGSYIATAKPRQSQPEPEPLKIKNKNGEWVLAAIPDEGTNASKLCELIIREFDQGIWAHWFNAKQIAFDGDVIRPLTRLAERRLSEQYERHIFRAGMTLGELWVEGLSA